MRFSKRIFFAAAVGALLAGAAQAIVVHIGCDGDGVPDSCSAIEVNDGGVVLVNLVTFGRNASGFFISTANTDGPLPDYDEILISGDDSLPREPALLIDEGSEHRVSSVIGSSYSNVTYEFRLGLGGDLELFGTYLEIDPNIFMTENVHLQAVLTVEGQRNEIILVGPPAGGSGAEPKSNTVHFPPMAPDQNGFAHGRLFLEALQLAPAALSLGAFEGVQIRWLVTERLFDDGFESNDTCRWSSEIPPSSCPE